MDNCNNCAGGRVLVADAPLMLGWRLLAILILSVLLVSACGTQIKRAIAPRTYTIKSGDTLYGISWRYGLDYRKVARWNGISPPYTIIPGRTLRLYESAVAQRTSSPGRSSSKPAKTAATTTRSRSPSSPKPLATTRLSWLWPASGRIIGFYSATESGKKGIDISGQPGEPVVAAASGKVVYSGNGLTGYGQLIIIKHNSEFLSAYAHNRKLLVNENELVKRGQNIAELGSTGTTRQPKLHFEIRRHGKPVDPLDYLPNR